MKTKLLLHLCCGPCATQVVEKLKEEYNITLFWSNSNIMPQEEYEKRLESARILAENLGLELVEDVYNHHEWLESVKEYKKEPEGGARCTKCFEYNLGRAAQFAAEKGIPEFTTTLPISPYKNNDIITEVASQLALENGVVFVKKEFSRQDFSKSVELSKKHKLYRQKYCGCEFSIRS